MEPISTKKSRRDRRNMGKSSRVSCMNEEMKPQIWEKFPEDLFEHVLVRLPIVIIIRFRTVCQQWNTLITSQSFSQYCAQVSQANPWFYTTFRDFSYKATPQNNSYKAMYDPFMKRWYYPNTIEIPTSPVSSVGGLVCFFEFFHRNLYVCNPLTQSFKTLPTGSIKSWYHSGMTINGSGGYRVLRFSNDREYEIYDSVTNNWGHPEKLPEIFNKLDFIISKPVSIDNTLYFMHACPEGIVSCNTSTGVWTQNLIQAPLNSSYLDLAKSDGLLMLAGMLRENDATFICIWEVEKVTFLLKEVDRRQFSEFQGRPVTLTCLGNKGLLLCYLRSPNMQRMFTYNIATRKWVKVRVPYGRKVQEQEYLFMYGTAFQPCLTAIP
ncbi:F-box only protein [Trifolium repens]|nr:F-box only protein [Trifolium repens]